MFGIKKLRKEVEELEERIWILENPPRFKKGDEVLCGMACVHGRVIGYPELKRWQYEKGDPWNRYWEYELLLTDDSLSTVTESEISKA